MRSALVVGNGMRIRAQTVHGLRGKITLIQYVPLAAGWEYNFLLSD
jgi:hypothetical protein